MPSSRFTCSAIFFTPTFVRIASRKPSRFSALHTNRAPGVNSRRSMTFWTTCVLFPFNIATFSSFCFSMLPSAGTLPGSNPASLSTSSSTRQVQSSLERPKTTRDLPLGRFMASHQRIVISAPCSHATFCSPVDDSPLAVGAPTAKVANLSLGGHDTRISTLLYSPLISFLLSQRCSISFTTHPCSLRTESKPQSRAGVISFGETTETTATSSPPGLAPSKWHESGK
mmetsp:Transcript_135105/g.337074  ORF Transcript_135105/g.337074 Transcript_135105/m.337074 type:complete len:227 (+) Transcript_135105:1994-2674(+)